MPGRHAHKIGYRDANEPDIVEVIKRYGYHYALLPDDADILVYLRRLVIVEVKNPEYRPKKKPPETMLTDGERAIMEHCQKNDILYYIVFYPEQMASIIEAWAL